MIKRIEYKADGSRTEKRYENGQLIEEIKHDKECTIMDMSNKVLEHIAMKYDSVREGVKAVMGGKILEYEAKKIKREGLEEGLKLGREEGLKEARKLGLEQGIKGTVSILNNLGIPQQTIQVQIQEQYQLSPEESKMYV